MIEVFFILGMVLVIGYLSYEFFELTRVPDVLFLVAVGLLLGPVLGVVNASRDSFVASLAPLVGTIALVIILFDGGLNLNFLKVLRELGKATVFTVVVFVLTALFAAVLMHFAFGWPLLHGLLLGFVVGGTSSAIVIPIVGRLVVGEEYKIILSLESALTDALCVVFALALIQVIKSGSVMLSQTAGQLASAFSIAIVIGAIAGFAWLSGLRRLHGRPFAYMLTLAIVFVLYAATEFVGGNGAIGVLVFGLMLGNFGEIAKRVKMEGEFCLSETLKSFQVEVSFFVRTFFFVYLGLVFNTAALHVDVVLVALAVVAVALAARAIAVKLVVPEKPGTHTDTLMMLMMPRGLAAAVLAAVPAMEGVRIPWFAEIVVILLVVTNVIATAGVFVFERQVASRKRRPPAKLVGVPGGKRRTALQ